MSNTVVVETLEQLKPFLNDKHVIEIVQRGKNKKFKNFVKVALNELPQTEEKALVENAVNVLNKNLQLNQRNLQLLANVAKSQKLGLLLNGLNLCATCVGFCNHVCKAGQHECRNQSADCKGREDSQKGPGCAGGI